MREMRDSGVSWIGSVPKTWRIGRIGGLYKHRNTKVSDVDFPPLSVTMNGVVPQLETAAKSDDHDNRKLVRIGDFAINSRSDRRGSCGISAFEGSVSLINTVLEPRDIMVPEYYSFLFCTTEFADEYYRWGHGIVDDLWTTRWQDMKSIKVPCPSIEEQKRIADYLSDVCCVIDNSKKTVQEEIEALLRLRKAVITKAVTSGLDHMTSLKESGVSWLEKIPTGWEIVPLKSICSFGKGVQYNKSELVEDGFPILSYGQVHSKKNTGTSLSEELIKFAKPSVASANQKAIVGENDILFAATSEDAASLGNCIFVDKDIRILAGTDTIILRDFVKCIPKYLAYLFRTDCWRDQFRCDAIEVKVYHLSATKLRRTSIVLPPSDEQKRIIDYLDKICFEIDAIVNNLTHLLNRLEDYRKSVIFACVTGKKEVSVS